MLDYQRDNYFVGHIFYIKKRKTTSKLIDLGLSFLSLSTEYPN